MNQPANFNFSTYQIILVTLLAMVLFTIVLDFMVISALSAILLPQLKITTKQFGLLVSAYPISAGVSAILLSGYADKFDRKRLLLFFYSGFVFGVLFCANANSYQALIIARIITGIFGGVVGSICFAIVTDLFETSQRGRAMGIVQMAFAGSQILGLPLALYLATTFQWQFAFWLIGSIGIFVLIIIFWKIKPINEHLQIPVKINPLNHSLKIFKTPHYLLVFLNNTLLVSGDIILMTFSAAYCTNNLGLSEDDLPLLYGIAGIATFIFAPIIGRMSDKHGKLRIFIIGTTIAILVVSIFTNLGETALWIVIIIHTFIFLGINARMIASTALATIIPQANDRGAFMAVDASLQQAFGGLAAVAAGLIVFQSEDGMINRFHVLGFVVIGLMLVTILLMYVIHGIAKNKDKQS